MDVPRTTLCNANVLLTPQLDRTTLSAGAAGAEEEG